MYVENANRASKEGIITVDNLEPNPKNPIIAAFFRNIGYADQLGSGVRKLFKYSKYYSGRDPQFVEDDVFRIVVPLDDEYSFDYSIIIDKDNQDKCSDCFKQSPNLGTAEIFFSVEKLCYLLCFHNTTIYGKSQAAMDYM